ncbi:MAG: hypothetical protein ACRDWI_14730 [Jiangellaceae bacterium]
MRDAAILATTEVDDAGIGPGPLGFLVFVGLLAAVFFLYRSMRKQMRRIDFDAEGQSDTERMRPDGPRLPDHGAES